MLVALEERGGVSSSIIEVVGQRITYDEGQCRAAKLKGQDKTRQLSFMHRTEHDQKQIDQGEIIDRNDGLLPLLLRLVLGLLVNAAVCLPGDQSKRTEHLDNKPSQDIQLGQSEFGGAAVQLIGGRLVFGQSVTWTRHQSEQLRHRVHEIRNLWQEEEQQRFAEVTQDAHHGKCHASKKAEGVANEHLRRISKVEQIRNW